MSQNEGEATPFLPKEEQPQRKWYDPRGWAVGTWVRLVILLLAIIGIVVAIVVFRVQKYIPDLLTFIKKIGWKGAFVFVPVYIICTVCFIPGSLLTLGGGFIFGLYWGTLVVFLGATSGAILAFLLGRTVMRKWVEEKVKSNPKFYAVDQAIKKEGWKIVLLLRLSPVIPFNLLNYSLALTDVTVIHYCLATAIGMLPGTILYVYFGSLAHSITDIVANKTHENLTTQIIIWVVSGVVIILLFLLLLSQRERLTKLWLNNKSSKTKISSTNNSQLSKKHQ